MNRVYLLLRNNLQTGPYSFDELLQQQLVASDLIWVEGKSLAWAYPYEIDDLKKSLTGFAVEPVAVQAIKPAQVKLPESEMIRPVQSAEKDNAIPSRPAPKKRKDEIEKRAEELRKKALAYKPENEQRLPGVIRSLHEFQPHLNENDAVHLVHHKSGKDLPVGEVLVAAMMLGLIVLGWYGGGNKYFFNRNSPVVNTVATQLVASDMHTASGKLPESVKIDSARINDTSFTTNTINSVAEKRTEKAPKKEARLDTALYEVNNEPAKPDLVASAEKKEAEKTIIPEKKSDDLSANEKDSNDKKPVEEKKQEIKKDDPPAAAGDGDKKKSLGDVFKGLFKKKKKDHD